MTRLFPTVDEVARLLNIPQASVHATVICGGLRRVAPAAVLDLALRHNKDTTVIAHDLMTMAKAHDAPEQVAQFEGLIGDWFRQRALNPYLTGISFVGSHEVTGALTTPETPETLLERARYSGLE